eukprot:TRINITY_DN1454_c0_g1_i2.p1 TRINITY_DN1454_c0_g1~~TRINITY_DN1454_c0_g1_i2.p1  ORF type:complete len:257 (+),score=51.37 TRINITY_DN1454_c0_g1_i2:91-861(+)
MCIRDRYGELAETPMGLREGSRWWTAWIMTIDPPVTLLTVIALRNITMRQLWDDNLFSDWTNSFGDLVLLAFVRVVLYFFFYIVIGMLRSWPAMLISGLTLLYLVVKASVVYTAGSVDANRCIVLLEQFVFAVAEAVMLNLLVRKWKSDDWTRLTSEQAEAGSYTAAPDLSAPWSGIPAAKEDSFPEGAHDGKATAPNGCGWVRSPGDAVEGEKEVYNVGVVSADTQYCHHFNQEGQHLVLPVSYTHLTLPTKRIV